MSVSLVPSSAERLGRPSSAADEASWLVATAHGDRQAFELLWERFQLPCLLVARRVLVGETHVEDVAQAVFLDIWRHAARFDPSRGTARAWILTLTHHKAVDRVRQEQRRGCLNVDTMRPLPDDDPSPEESAIIECRAESVQRALTSLTAIQWETLELAYFGGLTYLEISVVLDVPLGTVKARGRAGLARLREHLHQLAEVS